MGVPARAGARGRRTRTCSSDALIRSARGLRGRARGTLALGAVAGATTAAVVVVEVARVWRRGSAPLPAGDRRPARRGRRRSWPRPPRWRSPATGGLDPRERAVQPAHLVRHHVHRRARDHPPAALARRGGPVPRTSCSGGSTSTTSCPGILLAFVSGGGGDRDPQRGARAQAGDALRGRDGPDAGRVGAAARARGRLLVGGGHPQRAGHPVVTALLGVARAGPALPAPRRAGGAVFFFFF